MPRYGIYDGSSDQIVGYEKNAAMAELTQRLDNATSEKEKAKHMSDYLAGIDSDLQFRQSSSTAEDMAFSENYREVIAGYSERLKQARKSGTELYRKRLNAESIEEEEESRRKKQLNRALAVSRRAGVNMSDENAPEEINNVTIPSWVIYFVVLLFALSVF